MKILLLSAYDGLSHRYWRQGLVAAFPEYDWTQMTLPARYFSWRIRGNPLSWLKLTGDPLADNPLLRSDYDRIIATSMVDLATLRGLFPNLAAVPTLYYFHENQFEYPQTEAQHSSVEPQMVTIYGALAADRLIFNSDFNRQGFLAGVDQLMQKLPDHAPKGLSGELEPKSCVIPVPLRDASLAADNSLNPWPERDDQQPVIKIVWCARWEHDKGPDRLLMFLRQLRAQLSAAAEPTNQPWQIAILGEQFRTVPDAMQQIESEFADELVQFGFEPDGQRYLAWLSGADYVLSTAIHEFQGIAVLEAIRAQCLPLLPDRLAYPEWVPAEYLYPSSDDLQVEADAAVAQLLLLECLKTENALPAIDIDRFSWNALKPLYQEQFALSVS